MLDNVLFHQVLQVFINDLFVFVGLLAQRVAWVRDCKHLPERRCNCIGVIKLDRIAYANLKITSIMVYIKTSFCRFAWRYPAYRVDLLAT